MALNLNSSGISTRHTQAQTNALFVNPYSKVCIDSLIGGYYDRAAVDGLADVPQNVVHLSTLQFQDVNNLGLNNLTIKRNTHTLL